MYNDYEVVRKTHHIPDDVLVISRRISDGIRISKMVFRDDSLTIVVDKNEDSGLYEIRDTVAKCIQDIQSEPFGFQIFTDDGMNEYCVVRISMSTPEIEECMTLYTGVMGLNEQRTGEAYDLLEDIDVTQIEDSNRVLAVSVCDYVCTDDYCKSDIQVDHDKVRMCLYDMGLADSQV